MKYNKRYVAAIGGAAAAIILIAGITLGPTMLSRSPTPQSLTESRIIPVTTTNVSDSERSIAVGGGNLTLSLNQFSPSRMQVHPGESVTFYAPSRSTELHNVILDLSNGTAISSLEVPFILPSGVSPDALQLAPPNNFGELIVQNTSDGRTSIVALNKVLFNPSVVNQNGNVSYLQEQEFVQKIKQASSQGLVMPPLSGNYTLQGNEKIVSSGLILDFAGFGLPKQGGGEAAPVEGTADNSTNSQGETTPSSYPILSNFTVTFEKPGTYPFFCAFHPGMGGIVTVRQ
jgi:plastocyanin